MSIVLSSTSLLEARCKKAIMQNEDFYKPFSGDKHDWYNRKKVKEHFWTTAIENHCKQYGV